MRVLKLIVKSAANITSGSSSLASYYVTAIFAGKKLKTKPAVNSQNPIWNEELQFFFEDDQIKGGAVLFLLKRTSFFPLLKKKRVIAWCELHRDNVLKISVELQEFRLKWVDNVTGNICGVLIIACQIMDDPHLEIQVSDSNKEPADGSTSAIVGHFVIDIYHAEYLPRSDPSFLAHCRGPLDDKKDTAHQLIDPYLVFRFSDEEVRTKVIGRSASPEWMQRLFLPFKMPLLGLSLRLELKDKDLIGYDDLVATSDLSISEMTAGGATGFLPSFGPSYVNFYGSSEGFKTHVTRNSVQVEGREFRGRVFLQVTTSLGDSMPRDTGLVNIPPEIVQQSQVFLRKENFIIRVAFLDCYLTQDAGPKSIEVSIGPFGDSNIVGNDCIRGSSLPLFSPIPIEMEIASPSNGYSASWTTTDKPCIIYRVLLESSAIASIVAANLISNLHGKMTDLLEFLNVPKPMTRKLVIMFGNGIKDLKYVCQRVIDDGMYNENLTDINAEQQKLITKCLRIIIRESSEILDGLLAKKPDSKFLSRNRQILRNWLQIVDGLSKDIRQTFPDVFIWLCDFHTNQKIAYFRVAANEIWYDDMENLSGKLCDRNNSFKFKYPLGHSPRQNNPGEVSVRMWLGQEKHLKECLKAKDGTEGYAFFAEKYERLVQSCSGCLLKDQTWWMDAFGIQRFDKSNVSMEDWHDDGSWFPDLDMDVSSKSTNSALLTLIMTSDTQPVSTMDSRQGCQRKSPEMKTFTNALEMKVMPLDMNESAPKSAGRSSRWRMKMSYLQDSFPTFKLIKSNIRTHLLLTFIKERVYWLVIKRDYQVFIRRNNIDYKLANVSVSNGDTIIKMCLDDDIPVDTETLANPFIRITFGSRGAQTLGLPQTISPVWNECLLLRDVVVVGPNYAQGSPTLASNEHFNDMPNIIVEAYDYDEPDSVNFLGSASFPPCVGLPKWKLLSWRTLSFRDDFAGELLVGAELISKTIMINGKQTEVANFSCNEHSTIPMEIVPVLQRSAVELFDCAKKFQPFVEFLCFDVDPIASTDVLTQFPKINHFQRNHFIAYLLLPLDNTYLPSLTLRLKSVSYFNNILSVGGTTMDLCHLVSAAHNFQNKHDRNLLQRSKAVLTDVLYAVIPKRLESLQVQENLLEVNEDDSIDWWSRYYSSVRYHSNGGKYDLQGYKPLVIYNSPLEETEPYRTCLRLVHDVDIHSGMSVPFKNESTKVATLKVGIGLHRYEEIIDNREPRNMQSLQTTLFGEMSKKSLQAGTVLVRIYLIRAHGLVSKDLLGLADPYVRVQVDNNSTDVLGTLRHNTLDPLFGRVYESTLPWPGTPQLSIEVMDRDIIGGDDLIGRTTVDLETRLLLSPVCHSNCGASLHFLPSGPYAWRDSETPKKILDTIRKSRGFAKPFNLDEYYMKSGTTCRGMESCSLQEELLALHILHEMNWVVPEHVETRELFHPSFPGVTQGKLEMWIDMFAVDKNNFSPAAVDISPRTPKPYELRCIVYNAYDVLLDDRNLFGERMSDVYVEGWLDGLKLGKQATDVHYRCLDGKAHFNWRMVFPFDFVRGENVLVRNVRQRITDVFSSEILTPPILHLQLYDYDVISYDEPLGTLALPLLDMIPPLTKRKDFDRNQASLKSSTMPHSAINIFKMKHLRGFWPCFSPDGQQIVSKLELELELLTEAEAQARPAGRGRGEPNENPRLEKPVRSSDSVSWITSPWLAIKHVIWPKLRRKCIIFAVLVLFVILVYSTAKIIMDALVHKWVYSW